MLKRAKRYDNSDQMPKENAKLRALDLQAAQVATTVSASAAAADGVTWSPARDDGAQQKRKPKQQQPNKDEQAATTEPTAPKVKQPKKLKRSPAENETGNKRAPKKKSVVRRESSLSEGWVTQLSESDDDSRDSSTSAEHYQPKKQKVKPRQYSQPQTTGTNDTFNADFPFNMFRTNNHFMEQKTPGKNNMLPTASAPLLFDAAAVAGGGAADNMMDFVHEPATGEEHDVGGHAVVQQSSASRSSSRNSSSRHHRRRKHSRACDEDDESCHDINCPNNHHGNTGGGGGLFWNLGKWASLSAAACGSYCWWAIRNYNRNAAINNLIRYQSCLDGADAFFLLRPFHFTCSTLFLEQGDVVLRQGDERLAIQFLVEVLCGNRVLLKRRLTDTQQEQALVITTQSGQPFLDFVDIPVGSSSAALNALAWTVSIQHNAVWDVAVSSCFDVEHVVFRLSFAVVVNGVTTVYYMAVRGSDETSPPILILVTQSELTQPNVFDLWFFDPLQQCERLNWTDKICFRP